MTFRILSIPLLTLISLLAVSCKPEENSQSGVFGRVSAAVGDGGGAIVKMYNAPDISDDGSVWSVSGGEDAVGFEYDVKFAFENRVQSPVQVDTAGSDGSFQFEQVVAGNYIVVAEKAGHGWTIPREVSTSGGDIDLGELRLPREVVLQDVFSIDQNTTWETGVHYVIRDANLQIEEGATLTIEPGAVVCLSGGSSLEIRGSLVCQGTPENFVLFRAADVLGRTADSWQSLSFSRDATPPALSYVSFMNGSTAVDVDVNGGSIDHCLFQQVSGEGINARRQPPAISRCVFVNNAIGATSRFSSPFNLERCIFQSCDPFALVLDTITEGEIFCNWFRDCGGTDTSGSGDRGVIKLDLVTNTEFHNNFFETSWFAFQVGSLVDSTTSIHHNNFTRMNTVMNIEVTEDRRGPSNPLFNYNCFSIVDRFVVFVNCNQHNYLDMDATHNSWGTTSLATIGSDFVHDRADDQTCPTVNIAPVLNSCADVITETGTAVGICQ